MKLLTVVGIVLMCYSCSSEPSADQPINTPISESANEPKTPVFETLQAGVIHSDIGCTTSPVDRYCVYLPSTYVDTKAWPIMLFFDPQGNGCYPLELYRNLAETHGVILVGSNTAKNGMDQQASVAHAKRLYQELRQRFPIDANQEFLMGFSGGARVAAATLSVMPEFDAIIGCGAGFIPSANRPIPYMSMIGRGDFNYAEVMNTSAILDSVNYPYYLELFDSTHAWPPVRHAEQAFRFARSVGYRQDTTCVAATTISAWQADLNETLQSDDILSQAEAIKRSVWFATSTQQREKVTSVFQATRTSESYRRAFHYRTSVFMQDRKEQSYLQAELNNGNFSWWSNKVKELKTKGDQRSSDNRHWQAKRTLGFLGIAIYSYASRSVRSGPENLADFHLKLYELLEPENTEHAYLRAIYWCKKEDFQQAIASLEKATELGFDDVDRLKNDPDLTALQALPEFNTLFSNK